MVYGIEYMVYGSFQTSGAGNMDPKQKESHIRAPKDRTPSICRNFHKASCLSGGSEGSGGPGRPSCAVKTTPGIRMSKSHEAKDRNDATFFVDATGNISCVPMLIGKELLESFPKEIRKVWRLNLDEL